MRVWSIELEAVFGVQEFAVPHGSRWSTCSYNKSRNTVSVHFLVADEPKDLSGRCRLLVLREDEPAHVDAQGDWVFAVRWDSPLLAGHALIETAEPKRQPGKSRAKRVGEPDADDSAASADLGGHASR